MRTITKRDAEQFWRSMHQQAPVHSHNVIAKASQLWNYALDLEEDVVERNPFRRLGLPEIPSRSVVWQPEQIAKVVETALQPGPWGRPYGGDQAWCLAHQFARPSIALAIILAINIAQRPSDIRALRWRQYDGRVITLTQIKTSATVTIPCTEQLRTALDDAWRARNEGKIVTLDADGPIVANETTGHAWQQTHFEKQFRLVKRGAGVPANLQFRDLRRTATTHLAEAGCTLHEIASIGGWSLETVAAMMAVYGKVNVNMAENAIVKLEAYRKRPLEG